MIGTMILYLQWVNLLCGCLLDLIKHVPHPYTLHDFDLKDKTRYSVHESFPKKKKISYNSEHSFVWKWIVSFTRTTLCRQIQTCGWDMNHIAARPCVLAASHLANSTLRRSNDAPESIGLSANTKVNEATLIFCSRKQLQKAAATLFTRN